MCIRDSIRILNGFAGTGKSRIFTFVNRVLSEQETSFLCNPLVFATPTHQATKVLNAEGLASNTIASRLARPYPERFIETVGRVLVDEVIKGKKRRKTKKPVKLSGRSVFVLDEAGAVDTSDYISILKRVTKAGATFIAAGDESQCSPVNGTSPMFSLGQRYGAVTLKKIYRQAEQPWYLQATTALTAGRVRDALEILDEEMRLHGFDNMEDALAQACITWSRTGNHTPKDAIIVVGTNDEVRRANSLCQDLRKKAGVLGEKSLTIFETDKESKNVFRASVHVGDRIEVRRNSMSKNGYGVTNRDRGTVVAINGDNLVVDIDVRAAKTNKLKTALLKPVGRRTINATKFKHIRLGYSGTTQSWQGSSTQEVYCVLGSTMTSFSTGMVKITRGMRDCHISVSYTHLTLPTSDLV